MAKKTEGTDLTVVDFSPTLDVPENAPPLPVDVQSEALSFDDLFPENFFSMEALQAWLNERGAESRLLGVTGASIELLFDPSSEKPADGRWLPCLSFKETSTKLVVNKTRANQLRKLTGSPLMKDWAKVGAISIYAGIDNGKAQICIKRPPMTSAELDQFNKELFG